jgi:hypothetical protein
MYVWESDSCVSTCMQDGNENASYCILLTTKIYLLITKEGRGRHFGKKKIGYSPRSKAGHNNPCVKNNEKRV